MRCPVPLRLLHLCLGDWNRLARCPMIFTTRAFWEARPHLRSPVAARSCLHSPRTLLAEVAATSGLAPLSLATVGGPDEGHAVTSSAVPHPRVSVLDGAQQVLQ